MIHIRIDPILFQWGEVTVGWHGLWWMVGLFVAYEIFIREGQRKGIDPDHLVQLVLWSTVVGYIGARLLYVLHHWETYAAQPVSILAIHKGGIKLYGGLIGGAIVMAVYARYRKLSFWSLADAMAIGIPAGEIIGRVGCTINGDVWGIPTHRAWSLVYWHPNALIPSHLRGVPVFPVPTMLQIWIAGLLALLLVLRKRLHPSGTLFAIGIILYSLGRFVVNIWQPEETPWFGFKGTQVVSLALIGLGILLLLFLRMQVERKVSGEAD